jgi:hypothetical protein
VRASPFGGGGDNATNQCQVGEGYPNSRRHLLYDGRGRVISYQLLGQFCK